MAGGAASRLYPISSINSSSRRTIRWAAQTSSRGVRSGGGGGVGRGGKSSLSYQQHQQQQQPHHQMVGSGQMHMEQALSVASTTSHSTSATYKRPFNLKQSSSRSSQPYIHHGQPPYGGHQSDTESDMDQRSFDLASSHSSDDDRDYNDLDSMGRDALGKNNLSVHDYPKY